ncbi:ubiquinol-cytochrome c reductase iron-sulfur subunit [Blastochloris viridis]|uniref:Ubiquinol-cytochrome c reductase iron-sulfur subunit n=1 Tax=Blastochloris viridis TaxID=1079 RepID=A0A0H5BF84_BLAVI|nr:ubiquinol-cytochrome c reductase iron-sulfur subunit [Blastochloris viridis]ALK09256.1 Ubiquinol-cytochrome c reductase iron-sulfur subunit [Blastochloris viridis]BAS00873.1 ubiquinol-cytochrome C reductase iron-sulfur subunit [Blastochloris viridis]CUU41919.1 Ubiquinol-cytochrome c reductase iron-sulfur subunit [Blastochloris viridis]
MTTTTSPEPPASAHPNRRDILLLSTAAMGAAGLAAVAWPFIDQMNPDSGTIAQGAPIEFDIAPIADGQIVRIFWRGKPIFVRHRTTEEIAAAENTDVAALMDPEPDSARVKAGKAEWLVVFASCTHLGCIPLGHQGDWGGWFCPCHGSQYDTSGRVRKGPAPTNLPVPPYRFASDTKIVIGEA